MIIIGKKAMNQKKLKTGLILAVVLCLVLPNYPSGAEQQTPRSTSIQVSYSITKNFLFSEPIVITENSTVYVYLNESDLSLMTPGYPILPVNLSVMNLPFGTELINFSYTFSPPEITIFTEPLAYAALPLTDNNKQDTSQRKYDLPITDSTDPYPSDWVSIRTGGGLIKGNHTTFLILRIYPIRYFPEQHELQSIHNLSIMITLKSPEEPPIEDHHIYELLIISPDQFLKKLQPLVDHKTQHNVKTKLVGLNEVYSEMSNQGRDSAEKIKYYIKNAIEQWGVKYVLLVGGRKGQSFSWYLPVRYSHVVPYDDQEYAEQYFLSDLYYADIYDSQGGFSSWDSNGNNIFAEWTNSAHDEMDLYPDVYLGRLACVNPSEVKIMVDKIITYENNGNTEWFSKMLFVAGDSYNDTHHYNEGELISEQVAADMPGFTPVNVFASIEDINRQTVNTAIDQGCGFVYFVGHGNPMSWNTHYPPNGTIWCTGYTNRDMIYLKNREKLPIVVVGGCHNGQFDTTLRNILKGIREEGLGYFSTTGGTIGGFWYNEWAPNCWSWQLTSLRGGGAIATISNTGLGTHGDGDWNRNGIPDYLETLNGWMEIRFFQLYGKEHLHVLGDIHGDTITEYLHRFRGNGDPMDVKMVQQWELLGDPSLWIGGYQ